MPINKKILLLLIIPTICFANIALYDDLGQSFEDTDFKKIFSHPGLAACIWVQDYRKNMVYEGKVSKDTDIVMHNRCTEGALGVSASTAHSIEPVNIDIRHTGKAPEFSKALKQRYKRLFPTWKQTMQQELQEAIHIAETDYICDTSTTHGLNECTANIGRKPEEGNKISETFNSIKKFSGLFNK